MGAPVTGAACDYRTGVRVVRSALSDPDRPRQTGQVAAARSAVHHSDTLKKLFAPTLEKALTFLDNTLLPSTSNAVERGNRRYRKMQHNVYRVRTQRRSVRALHWICGAKPKPKAGNKRSPHSIRHGLDKPGIFTTVSRNPPNFTPLSGETAMPFYENGDVCIHYEETGSGFPLLIPGGGLNSTIGFFTGNAPFNPIEEFQGEYRVIAADLRNANGGESSGPLAIDRPWDAYADDQLGVMDHLGIARFRWASASAALSSGTCCSGHPSVSSAVLVSPADSARRCLTSRTNNMKGWGPALCECRPDITMAMVDAFLTNMYTKRADFVYTVTRDFARSCRYHPGPAGRCPGAPIRCGHGNRQPRPKCRGRSWHPEGARRTARQDGATSARLPPGT